MSTVAEIETAIRCLSDSDRVALLDRLRATDVAPSPAATTASREEWMRRLDALRAAAGNPAPPGSGEQILSELRGD